MRKEEEKPQEEKESPLSRRRFIQAGGLFTLVFLGVCGRRSFFFEPEIDGESTFPKTTPSGGGFGLPTGRGEAQARVAIARLDTYDRYALKATIASSFEAIGGLADLIKPGDTVGLKLNMTGGEYAARKTPQDYGRNAVELYWTHPEILRAVGELCLDTGARRLVVVEANYDEASYRDWGYRDVVRDLGAVYYNLNLPAPYGDFLQVPVPTPLTHWESYFHNGILYDLDCFISLPKVKRHLGGGITGAMKNMIGSVPLSKYQKSGAWREKLHCTDDLRQANTYEGFRNLVRTIVDLNKIRPIHLSVCDAILTADFGEGPWIKGFTPAAFNTLITSKDPVAADAIGVTLFGFDPTAPDRQGPFAPDSMRTAFAGTDNYLRIASEEGVGIHDPSKIELVDATVTTRVHLYGMV